MNVRSDIREVRLCLLGFGSVAQRFCEIVAERADDLADRFGVRYLVTAVGTRSHGSAVDQRGWTTEVLLTNYQANGNRFASDEVDGPQLIGASGADVLVEATPLEHRGTVAITHLESAFSNGLDVITVNKGPIAWAYSRMKELAESNGRQLRFEGITMDGCPVYNLAEFCLPGDRILGFRGVLNSTTNYVLDAMAQGASLDEAIADAQLEGITETDPSQDIDGHDAAAKVAALANVLMDADITPDNVERDSIRDVTPDDLAKAFSYGRRLRVICSAVRVDDRVAARVALEPVKSDDPMYWIQGTSSSLVLHAELAGTVEIVERDGLVTQTAYAIYADLLTLYGRR